MESDVTPTRRHVVTAAVAAMATTAGVSACSGSDDPSVPGTSPGTGTPKGPASSPVPAGSATPTGGAGETGPGDPTQAPATIRVPTVAGPDTDAPNKPLARLSDVQVGRAVQVGGADGTPIVIARPEKGKVVAFSAICTHMGCTVKPAGSKLVCPCHKATYDAFTGNWIGGHTATALPRVAVTVDGDNIVAG